MFFQITLRGALRGGEEYTIDTLKSDDLGALASIEKQCFSEPWSQSAFAYSISAPFTFCAAMRSGGALMGYCIFSHIFGEGEIQHIAISPDMRRRGCADALLGAVLEYLRGEGCERVFLEVRESNSSARALYEKHGFCAYGLRRGYYTNPLEDAVLMKKEM